MKIAVLSGKGGAGKTFVAVNLAAALQDAAYVDCDVEEPNGRLFFSPKQIQSSQVSVLLPVFDEKKCSGCRKCVDFCRFNALVFLKGRPKVFAEVCHSCGGCKLACPESAVTETGRVIGAVEAGKHGKIDVITGVLNPGEASGVPVIRAALKTAENLGRKSLVIDCPPGTACPVMESVSGADYCLLVAETTAFGLHNFIMAYHLVRCLNKPCGVIVNKMDEVYPPLEAFCRENNVPVLLRIPYDGQVAALLASGGIASKKLPGYRQLFAKIYHSIGGGGH